MECSFDSRFKAVLKAVYDFDVSRMGSKDRAIVAFLDDLGVKGRRCLDAGPGTGRWVTFLRKRGAAFLAAADISSVSLERCRDICDTVAKVDLERDLLPYPDASFDLIVSFEVLEHLREPELFLGELRRVTAPGGTVLMSVPNVASFISRLRLLAGGLPPSISADPTHVRHYRRRDVEALLARFGLDVRFLPVAFSVNPYDPKSRWCLPAVGLFAGLEDSLLFFAKV